ncbi:MAG: hypothetical protein ACHQ9S_27150 [Candidatus Binatia bacterium]
MGHAQQCRGGSIVVDGLGNAIVVPEWFGNAGPTFSGSGKVLNKRNGVLACSVGKLLADKKAKKMAKKMAKLAKSTPTYASKWSRDMELSCSRESLQQLGKVAKNANAPRGERMDALVRLDAAAFKCNGLGDGVQAKGVVQKAAKKEARERRMRYEFLAYNAPDVTTRARAQAILFGELG